MGAIIKTDAEKKPQSLDFDAICDTRTAVEELVVLDGNGLPTPLKIRLMSRDSDAWRRRLYDAQVENAKFRDREVPLEKIDNDALDMLVAVTVDWEGITRNGQPMPCTPENARQLYQKAPWIADQVNAFCRERENFMRK